MNKVYAFVILVPFIAFLLFLGISFYQFDTSQRYLNDLVQELAYKAKITGIITNDDLTGFRDKISKIATFEDSTLEKAVEIQKRVLNDGTLSEYVNYTVGEPMKKGDFLMIFIKSSDVSYLSRIVNFGVSSNDNKNLYYAAKTEIRIEMQ